MPWLQWMSLSLNMKMNGVLSPCFFFHLEIREGENIFCEGEFLKREGEKFFRLARNSFWEEKLKKFWK